jgi:hypothetical protein
VHINPLSSHVRSRPGGGPPETKRPIGGVDFSLIAKSTRELFRWMRSQDSGIRQVQDCRSVINAALGNASC